MKTFGFFICAAVVLGCTKQATAPAPESNICSSQVEACRMFSDNACLNSIQCMMSCASEAPASSLSKEQDLLNTDRCYTSCARANPLAYQKANDLVDCVSERKAVSYAGEYWW